VFVDVRAQEEFVEGHLEGSINIPYNRLEERIAEIKKDELYIFYCIHSSWRAPYAANVLADLAYDNIYVLEGGIAAWNAGDEELADYLYSLE